MAILFLPTNIHFVTQVVQADIEQKTIPEMIQEASTKYNVPYNRIYNIIDCETAHTFDPEIQSMVRYNFSSVKRGIVKGEQERSYGLAQIHLPDHPSISYAQATNPEFAIDFIADNLSKGRYIWYCKS